MQNVPIQSVRGNDRNPRKLDKEKFQKLVQSIKDFPEMLEKRPLVVADGVILGGNMRHKAAIEAGLKEIPVIDASEWTDKQKEQFIIKDNLSFGEWDWDVLANEWDAVELEAWGLDVWTPEEEPTAGLTDEDDVPEVPEAPTTQAGDLYLLGKHRLLCGDSTNADDVARLMDGATAKLMVTDPPYGVSYDASWRNEALKKAQRATGQVSNDNRANWTEAYSLWSGNVAYVWHDGKASPLIGGNLESCGLVLRNLIIWGKNQHAISRGNYHHKHEPCWYAVRKGENAGWIGDRSQTTLWDIDKPRKSETGHSTQKPVECMEIPLQNHEGDVYDPFLGSGTTLIAAEKTGRTCYGMELDPKYCDVIVKRWEDFTGKKAERVTKA